MKKKPNIVKEELEKLYIERKLPVCKIAERFGCSGVTVYYWINKFKIKKRGNPRKVHIPKEKLKELYWDKKLSTQEIAKMFGLKHGRNVLKKIKNAGLKTKTISEANTVKMKEPFSGPLEERAYFLGLRAGDFYAKWARKSVRIQTTTTHKAQLDLLKEAFNDYGETRIYFSTNKKRADEWFTYVDLHPSFEFLLDKPEKIPTEILDENSAFYNFLAAYADCEASWNIIKSHEKHIRTIFRIKTGDKEILDQIKNKLTEDKFSPSFYLDKKKGSKTTYGKYSRDIYDLTLYRKQDVLKLIKKIYKLSKHSEKIRKMDFILKNHNKRWNEIEADLINLKEKINSELLKNQSEYAH